MLKGVVRVALFVVVAGLSSCAESNIESMPQDGLWHIYSDYYLSRANANSVTIDRMRSPDSYGTVVVGALVVSVGVVNDRWIVGEYYGDDGSDVLFYVIDVDRMKSSNLDASNARLGVREDEFSEWARGVGADSVRDVLIDVVDIMQGRSGL